VVRSVLGLSFALTIDTTFEGGNPLKIFGPFGEFVVQTEQFEIATLLKELITTGVELPLSGRLSPRSASIFQIVSDELIARKLAWYKLDSTAKGDLAYFNIETDKYRFNPEQITLGAAEATLRDSISFIQQRPGLFMITPLAGAQCVVLTTIGMEALWRHIRGEPVGEDEKKMLITLTNLGVLGLENRSSRLLATHDQIYHHFSRSEFPLNYLGAKYHKPVALMEEAEEDLPQNGEGTHLARILSRRRSRRKQGVLSISLSELLDCLVAIFDPRNQHDGRERYSFPAAGGIYAFRVVVHVGKCQGLERGSYLFRSDEDRRDGSRQRLYGLENHDPSPILLNASRAWGMPGIEPQVVVSVLFDFEKISRKYSGIAYRLALLNAGAIIQTMYLVAEAQNLAGCAIGGGDIHDLAMNDHELLGEYIPLVEFALGSRNH
jgi:SagB-type dehydrogenase family enzyme